MTDDADHIPGERALRYLLREDAPKPRWGGLLVLVVSLAAFVLASGSLGDPKALALISLVCAGFALMVVYRPQPGVARPLTQTATSADGHVRLRYPASFKLKSGSPPNTLTLSRALGDGGESIVINSTPLAIPTTTTELSERWLSLTTNAPERTLLTSGETCHHGDGRQFLLAAKTSEGFEMRALCCAFQSGGRFATTSVLLAAALYDKEATILRDIVDTIEILP